MADGQFLELVEGPAGASGRSTWTLTDTTIVGRGDVKVSIPISAISRHHAKLEATGDGFSIIDLNSRNGTVVNGQPVGTEPMLLAEGDLIVLGGSTALRFHDPNATPYTGCTTRLTGLWVDPTDETVWVDSQQVEPPLSSRQHALLQCIYHARGSLVSRKQIVDQVWGAAAYDGVTDQALDALVKRLRQRLSDYEHAGSTIQVVKGRGLRLRSYDGPELGR